MRRNKIRKYLHLILLLIAGIVIFFGFSAISREREAVFGYDIMTMPPEMLAGPDGDLQVSINNGDAETSSRFVTLTMNAGTNAVKMAVANDPAFTYSSIENFQSSIAWDLCALKDGVQSPADCPEGDYTVYVKFFTDSGQTTAEPQSASISFTTALPVPNYKLSPEAHRLDLNFDDKINTDELGFLNVNWGKTGGNAADFNQDKRVDIKDFNLLMQYWTN